MIRHIGHVSFTVSDVDVAAAWYVDHLGFELLHRQRQDNAYTRELVGVPDAILEVAVLRAPGEPQLALELVQYAQPSPPGEPPLPGTVGFSHISLTVDDIQSQHRDLVEAGVRFRSPPVEITAGINRGGVVWYFTDLDGNGLELFQPPSTVQGVEIERGSALSRSLSTSLSRKE